MNGHNKFLDWKNKPITEKQQKLIAEMNEFSSYPLPDFNGKTRGEAAGWIDKNMKLAHTSTVDLTTRAGSRYG